MNLLKAILDILASLLGIARNRSDAQARPDMQANARAKTDAEIRADAAETMKQRDLNDLRRKL